MSDALRITALHSELGYSSMNYTAAILPACNTPIIMPDSRMSILVLFSWNGMTYHAHTADINSYLFSMSQSAPASLAPTPRLFMSLFLNNGEAHTIFFRRCRSDRKATIHDSRSIPDGPWTAKVKNSSEPAHGGVDELNVTCSLITMPGKSIHGLRSTHNHHIPGNRHANVVQ